ncbi:MAG: acid phosphatase [Rhodospirillales bacterium 20-60-12]|nr:MAG: acid phosphatase [Rhodospirillales bacterium 20-60-12]HQT68376.1 signal peptide peptidase SppA [Acetobacteraceae bacterium]
MLARIFGFIWMIFRFGLIGIGVITLAFILLVAGLAEHFKHGEIHKMPDHYVLNINLTQGIPDKQNESPFESLQFNQTPTLVNTLLAIDNAAHNPQVEGVQVKLGGGCCSLTTAEELHNALMRYRKISFMPVTAIADSFDGAPGLGSYDIATAANKIEMSAAGDFSVTGLSLETPFAGALLTQIGVSAQFPKMGAYKSYPETFTRTGPSDANSLMLNSLADSLYTSFLAPVAERMKQTPAQISALIDAAPYTPADAKAKGLIDEIIPLTGLPEQAGIKHVKLADYIKAEDHAPVDATKIGLIIASGDIEAPSANGGSGDNIEPAKLAAELAHAIKDKSIKAIILRVDSPGGTVTGSAVIGAELAKAADAHKPVIVSMGGLAASGGYWISSHGAKIVADPATLTGSIGVFAGKFSYGGLLQKLNVSLDAVSRGANAGLDDPATTWTPAQMAAVQTMIEGNYQQFVGWVAAGRHMTPAQIEAIAQGRVWTGAQAVQNGLVDQLGGYNTSFAVVRQALGLKPNAPIDLVNAEPEPSLHEILAKALSKANPLSNVRAAALLPAPLQMLMKLQNQQRLEMLPIEIR